jgi:hypothetical protein
VDRDSTRARCYLAIVAHGRDAIVCFTQPAGTTRLGLDGPDGKKEMTTPDGWIVSYRAGDVLKWMRT